jgi:glutathione S-transferase
MVLKLHTHNMASCGRRVAVILFEKQVPFQLIEPDSATGEIKTPEWRAKQPFGQMPYIDDDGFILFESRAIARYIATKYASSGTNLLPDTNDVKAMALVDQGISIETSNFNPVAEGLLSEKVMKTYVRFSLGLIRCLYP